MCINMTQLRTISSELFVVRTEIAANFKEMLNRSPRTLRIQLQSIINLPESFLLCRSSVMWCEVAELSSVFRFRATSDNGSRSSWWSCWELSPMFRRSSFFAWNEFCDSNKRSCCWCKRFLIRKIFGILTSFQRVFKDIAKIKLFTFLAFFHSSCFNF